ncbi:hypothetical protein TNCV_2928691 [Trichonephila clavipes]|nr:hypothetical protein TNCV_2928691 [Trichonephila clavipes]
MVTVIPYFETRENVNIIKLIPDTLISYIPHRYLHTCDSPASRSRAAVLKLWFVDPCTFLRGPRGPSRHVKRFPLLLTLKDLVEKLKDVTS